MWVSEKKGRNQSQKVQEGLLGGRGKDYSEQIRGYVDMESPKEAASG